MVNCTPLSIGVKQSNGDKQCKGSFSARLPSGRSSRRKAPSRAALPEADIDACVHGVLDDALRLDMAQRLLQWCTGKLHGQWPFDEPPGSDE